MSNELVVLNNGQPNSVALHAPPPEEDLTGLSETRSKPGNIVLIQPTTINSYGGRPGQFLDTFDNSVYDSIVVVPLRTSFSRVYFPEGETTSRTPLCGSNDGKVPRANIERPQNNKCGDFVGGKFIARCPKAVWGKGKPPACSDQRRLFCIIKDTGLPAFLTISGLSVKQYEIGINKIKKDIALNSDKNKLKLALYDYYFTLKSEKAAGRPTFYISIAESIKRVGEVGQYADIFQQLVVNYKNAAEQVEEYHEAEGSVDGAVSNVIDAEFVDQTPQAA